MSAESPSLALESLLDPSLGFDYTAAFQGAASDVISNETLRLDEKVARTEQILTEANSEVYRGFVDMRSLVESIGCDAHEHGVLGALEQGEFGEHFGRQDAHRKHDSDDNAKNEKRKKQDKSKSSARRLGWFATKRQAAGRRPRGFFSLAA
jgi:hypothetical protein